MKRRIVSAALLVTILAVTLFALPLAVAVQRRQRDEDRRELTQLAALAASRIPRGIVKGGAITLPGIEPDQQLGYYGTSGELLAGTGPARLEQPVTEVLLDHIADTTIAGLRVVGVPVVGDAGVVGATRAAEPLSAGRARVRGTWLALTVLAGIVCLLAAAAAQTLARRLIRPLDRLRADATRIGDGDFTVTPSDTGLTELDQLGAALARTAGRLSGLLAREQAFSSDASHQLRTPLAGLRLTLESELIHPRADPRTALQEALDDVDRLEATISELLALARDVDTPREPLDLADVLDDARQRWHGVFARAGRPLRIAPPRPVPALRVSRPAVNHILDVLLDNAERHGEGEVRIETRTHPHAVTITVSDEGPGVHDPGALFERQHPGATGTGIGLAMARRLAEAEGGRLRLVAPQPGATFELALPTG
jgi:signal transduction histidine kinase